MIKSMCSVYTAMATRMFGGIKPNPAIMPVPSSASEDIAKVSAKSGGGGHKTRINESLQKRTEQKKAGRNLRRTPDLGTAIHQRGWAKGIGLSRSLCCFSGFLWRGPFFPFFLPQRSFFSWVHYVA